MSSRDLAHNNLPSLPARPKASSGVATPNSWGVRKPPAAVTIAAKPFEYDPMLTERQAAVVLNKPMETLKKWRQRGEGPAYMRYHDGSIRYAISALAQYLKECVTGQSVRRRNHE